MGDFVFRGAGAGPVFAGYRVHVWYAGGDSTAAHRCVSMPRAVQRAGGGGATCAGLYSTATPGRRSTDGLMCGGEPCDCYAPGCAETPVAFGTGGMACGTYWWWMGWLTVGVCFQAAELVLPSWVVTRALLFRRIAHPVLTVRGGGLVHGRSLVVGLTCVVVGTSLHRVRSRFLGRSCSFVHGRAGSFSCSLCTRVCCGALPSFPRRCVCAQGTTKKLLQALIAHYGGQVLPECSRYATHLVYGTPQNQAKVLHRSATVLVSIITPSASLHTVQVCSAPDDEHACHW